MNYSKIFEAYESNIVLFSYGSNMLQERITKRINSKRVGIGWIDKHQLKFHKLSKDKSGKADAYFTDNINDKVYGVISTINVSDKDTLDRIEGLGFGYRHKIINVNYNGGFIQAVMYIAEPVYIKNNLLPFEWYKDYVISGAVENKLPKDYIEKIKNINTI